MHHMFYWLEREIWPFKLEIFIFNWINVMTHPPCAHYIKQIQKWIGYVTFLQESSLRRLINNHSLEKLAKTKLHAFLYFSSFNYFLENVCIIPRVILGLSLPLIRTIKRNASPTDSTFLILHSVPTTTATSQVCFRRAAVIFVLIRIVLVGRDRM